MKWIRLPHVVIVAGIISAAGFTGCMQRIGDFTVVSTKNFDSKGLYKLVGRMEGSDKRMLILGIPLGIPNMKNAVDNAIDAGGGIYLANAVIESGGWNAGIVGQMGYTATGDVYALADKSDLLNPSIEKFELFSENNSLKMVSTTSGREIAVQDIDDVAMH